MKKNAANSISVREKIGYGFGDFACNLVYASISSYLLFFYTDVFGIASSAAAFMFFIVRIIDAVSDPIVGIIIDKTNTKYGKFRPFLLYGAIPFAILAILCFTTPSLHGGAKLLYAYATYIALSVCYTLVNVPYGALTSAMTQDQHESVSITTFRTFLANIGQVIVAFCVPLLADTFSKSMSLSRSWQLTMLIIGSTGGILLLICFKSTKERVKVPSSHQKIKFSDIFEQFRVNRPLVVLAIFFLVIYGVKSIVSATGVYYVTYYVGKANLVKWYSAIGTFPALIIIPFIPWLSRKLSKKQLMTISIITDIVGMVGLFILPKTWIVPIFISRGIASVGNGMISAYMWALIPETVEYGEWKTNKRLGGMIYAVIGFFFKCGNALGGMIPGIVLAASGYVAHKSQTPSALHGILITTAIIPICLYAVAIFCMRFYNLDKDTYSKISAELQKRNALELQKEGI
ncbi:glycoside-pentoside-hexuronide (GPH):cation symporter [Clostridium felsineum]|uniref:Isoprimeverose transporter n=1 Tax=Clostridium felsineum TaxID=36839 RepID=A0A1S8LZV2_9CLOT|nr:MFS transporter [Clostridium felsineum]URZ05061.1 Isoprimeverose transporter [Clostridium felsineum]URZ10102.1 Isoprimeverose transporter [Clostridium felsineum]